MKFQSKGAGSQTRRSPLYTSRTAELAKRTIIREAGRDRDGAYRAYGRIDEVKPKRTNG